MFQVDLAVPADVHQVYFTALLLEGSQGAAYGGMLQRRGNDVSADVPGGLHDALEGQVVGLAGPGGVNNFFRLHPQHPGDVGRHPVHLRVGGLSGGMGGVGVADKLLLRPEESLQHGGVRRGVGGVV